MYEESANQSGYEQQNTVVEAQQEFTEPTDNGQESPPQEQPKGITVKYNKEDRFIADEEVSTWVQKGLNYDKVSERAKEAERYQQMVDRTARYYGYDNPDDYMAALEQAETERRIQQEAEKLGVDEEVIRNHLQPLNQKLSEYERQLKEIKEQEMIRSIDADIQRLSGVYPDFDKYKQAAFELASSRGYSLEDAYKISSYEDRLNAAKLEAQNETIRNLQLNAASSTGALGADAPEQASGYSAMSAAEKKTFREQNRRRM
ncbi:hypothetical protein [Paenibacillus taiwanensis]|uniref:hypothetical protein n=1 Tax=Paenibacillus taiwanensis TaxID=401638 RepID=UPI000402822D|nr:hypothetical protein [Paenibacillus taiwanensis]